MTDALIRAENIFVTKAGRHVLEDISMVVRQGEIVTLIGPNGSGKSTLVKTVLGLEQPDQGNVQRAEALITGYVPQHVSLDRALPLTVERLMKVNTGASLSDINTALDEVGMTGLHRRSVHDLSGGERQRVLLARALLRKSNLLVLDEPTQNVDVAGAAELYCLIADIRDRTGCGVLLVSHDLHVVMAATDQVYCLHHHICCSGKPEAVRTDPAFADLFGPAAGEVLALYAHSHDHTHDSTGQVVHHHEHADG